jgi:hypothetical protein
MRILLSCTQQEHKKMKPRMMILLSCLTMGLALTGSAFAQVANPSAESQWQSFLSNHPGVSSNMANNPNYLSSHPGVATWLEQHPDVAAQARQDGQIGNAYGQNRYGNAYGQNRYGNAYGQNRFGGAYGQNQWRGAHARNHYAQRYNHHFF